MTSSVCVQFNDLLLVSSESSWNITGGDKFRAKYSFNLNHTKVRADVITRDNKLAVYV